MKTSHQTSPSMRILFNYRNHPNPSPHNRNSKPRSLHDDITLSVAMELIYEGLDVLDRVVDGVPREVLIRGHVVDVCMEEGRSYVCVLWCGLGNSARLQQD